MKIKKLKKITIGAVTFEIKWNKEEGGGYFCLEDETISVGTKYGEDDSFQVLCHEVMEICHTTCNQRYNKPDHHNNYLFCYDHSGFTTSMEMFVGIIRQFIQ